jgi:hypothetical protein
MPLSKDDVLSVLSDPRLNSISFAVGPIVVNANAYHDVAEYIRDDDIQVLPGNEALAFYDGRLNTITTQAGNPPLNLADSAQLLHECTHAIADINNLDVLRLHDEAAGYIAQLTFMAVADPKPFTPRPAHTRLSPRQNMTFTVQELIQKYDLTSPRGITIQIDDRDIQDLAKVIHTMPDYQDVGLTMRSHTGGVPITHNQMRALKAALTQAKRAHNKPVYAPSPRLEIF